MVNEVDAQAMLPDPRDDMLTGLTAGQRLADDMLIGAQEIADFTGNSLRRTFYLLERGELPGFKIGDKWHGRKSTFVKSIEDRERAAMSSNDRRAQSNP